MADKFYKFSHECESMPPGASFCRMRGSDTSQFTFSQSKSHVGVQSSTLWGFRFCPYCGWDSKEGGE